MTTMPHYFEHTVNVPTTANVLFEYLDDPKRLGAHMAKSSWMMAGSRMDYQFDATEGKAQGARIQLQGKMMGLSLHVEEVVTQHEPPLRKVWKTVGAPHLLIIGHYEMGFVVAPATSACQLRIFISYELPKGLWQLAGWLLGGLYARWCVRSMATDAARHFSSLAA